MKKLRILFVTGIFPPDHGGPASYVPAIAVALAKTHLIQSVITLSNNVHQDDSAYPFPVVRILRSQNRFVRKLKTILTIRKLARDVDVVYLNGLVLEGIISCKLLGRKKVAIKVVGDLIWERACNSGETQESIDEFQNGRSHGMKLRILKKLQGWYTGQADVVITPSRYLAGIVAGWGVCPGKIRVVYNALLNPSSESLEDCQKLFDCVTVARLVPWKGISDLIQITSRNKWSLNIVGDGPLRAELGQQVSNNGLNGLVRFAGHVSKDQVAGEIAKARIFILNSTYEGLPHIVLEAKGAGVPVIATAVGGTPETIDDGEDGFLVPPGDGDALEVRIQYLLDNSEERERISLASRRQALDKFSFQTMLSETEKVLRELCPASNGNLKA